MMIFKVFYIAAIIATSYLLEGNCKSIIGPNNHRYTGFNVALDWQRASLICEAAEEGGHLLILNEPEEVNIAMELFASFDSPPHELLHAGVTDNGHGAGNYVDVTGERIVNAFWERDQPDNGAHCVATNKYGLYDDQNCDKEFYFICESYLDSKAKRDVPLKLKK